MTSEPSLEALWAAVAPGSADFQPERIARLPDPARRYLMHAIAPGTRLASAVRLSMHGEIKLRRWQPFAGEEVIAWERGMVWSARTRMAGLPVRGADSLVDGVGEMRWKVLGILPLVRATGLDVARSAAGRIGGESVWLPTALCGTTVTWTAPEPCLAHAAFPLHGERIELDLSIDAAGRVAGARFPRWGDPDGRGFRSATFAVVTEAESAFSGFTIPTRLRAGWIEGGGELRPDDEFFRVTIDRAEYR